MVNLQHYTAFFLMLHITVIYINDQFNENMDLLKCKTYLEPRIAGSGPHVTSCTKVVPD